MRLLAAFLVFLLLLLTKAEDDDNSSINIKVNLETVHFRVSDRYMCVTIDSNAMRYQWRAIDLTAPLVVTLAKALHPVTLRVGGTYGDYAYFVPDSNSATWKHQSSVFKEKQQKAMKSPCMDELQCMKKFKLEKFNFSTHDWDILNEFVQNVGWEFVFGLNSNIRMKNGTWDSSNAEELVRYTISKNYSLLAWELGNEPSTTTDHHNSVLPETLVNDFQTLEKLLQQLQWPDIRLVGPNVATIADSSDFFRRFLQATKPGFLRAVTYHHYYMAGSAAKEDDFISASTLDRFALQAWLATSVVEQLQPDAELWLGETSSTYGGGTAGLSDVYIAGFMWLDKLGLAAVRRHSKVFRQTFFGGWYSLTNPDYTPRPDYWLSLLFVRLVGSSVLSVSDGTSLGRTVRVYAHCVRSSNHYQKGGVVLYILNLQKADVNITLSDEYLINSSRDIYWLEPGDNAGLVSRLVSLNGQVITMNDHYTLPELLPKEQPPSKYISLPHQSFGFVVFKEASAPACMNI